MAEQAHFNQRLLPFSRRLGHWGLATQLPGLFFYGCRSLEHDGRHLTRSHDRGLRIHELEDTRLHALWQALEPLQPPVGR